MPTVAAIGIGVVEAVGLAFGHVSSNQSITQAPVASGAVAYGPRVTQSTVTPSTFTAKVYRRATPTTLVVELDESFDRSFQDQLSHPGTGSLSVMNDDTDLASVQPGDLIRMYVHGVNAWTMLARDFDRISLAQGEDADQYTTISGPGHLAMLDEAVMYPALGVDARPIEEDRTFNWSSLGYDDSGWGYANALVRQDGTSIYWTGLPDANWPDGTAYWIWGSGNLEIAAPGHCYFRHEFTVPAGVYKVLVYICADAQGDVFFDGARIITTTFTTANPTETRSAVVDVTPGTHLVAVDCLNDPDPENDGLQNPGGFLLSVYATDALATQGALITNSTSSWRLSNYPPEPPGMSPGEVIRTAVEEAQARGALSGVTLGFDDVVDSDGVPWTFSSEIATKVGTTVLSFMEELAGTYIDIWMSPQFVLHAWARGGRGVTKSATYAVGTTAPTGGTITTDGAYTVHTFNSSGTLALDPAASLAVDYLVVGAGGGGGSPGGPNAGGGGGGGGQVLSGSTTLTGAQTVTVGSGGGGAPIGGATPGVQGGSSILGAVATALGGGGGGNSNTITPTQGGSGGGGGGSGTAGTNAGAAANGTGTTAGGSGFSASGTRISGGGGGGASVAGSNAGTGTPTSGGNGGAGIASSITGASATYGGGGGGGTRDGTAVATGGTGGGGSGRKTAGGAVSATAGTANTGGGGGGGAGDGVGTGAVGEAGGHGVVIVRYLTPTASTANITGLVHRQAH